MTHSFSSIDDLGDGYGFRKVRQALDVTAFGVNAIVYPPGFEGFLHYHDEQDELYFVHAGTARVEVDGETASSVLAASAMSRRQRLGRCRTRARTTWCCWSSVAGPVTSSGTATSSTRMWTVHGARPSARASAATSGNREACEGREGGLLAAARGQQS